MLCGIGFGVNKEFMSFRNVFKLFIILIVISSTTCFNSVHFYMNFVLSLIMKLIFFFRIFFAFAVKSIIHRAWVSRCRWHLPKHSTHNCNVLRHWPHAVIRGTVRWTVAATIWPILCGVLQTDVTLVCCPPNTVMAFPLRHCRSPATICPTRDWCRLLPSANKTFPIRNSRWPPCSGVRLLRTTWACWLDPRNRVSC